MASILMLLTSSPASQTGQRALSLAESLVDQGHLLTLCCLQDATLLGSDRSPREARGALESLLERGARCLVLGEDLACRGLAPAHGAKTVNHAGVVDLLAGPYDRLIGAL
jgi:sulfur transfer complex TusBCD TusB component (DsrH family)